eukprot:TRINITY_DN3370_c0_g1_i1.p1 TRINITY_DN3370_c0_g1~~TRINITY_DN3370_c0_g1_i1.p1  ORF type:complete len:243 (-),score=12.95 TRINITY_DN3370_c0_g1_i1:459-1187(-)
MRVVSKIKKQMALDPRTFLDPDSQDENEIRSTTRSALSRINKRRERIVAGIQGVSQLSISNPNRSRPNERISVFHDDSQDASDCGLSGVTSSTSSAAIKIWNDYGSDKAREKENRGEPSQWKTGPLYPVRGHTEEERKRRQLRRERRRAREIKKRREMCGYTVFCDMPQEDSIIVPNFSRNLHNIEAHQSFTDESKRHQSVFNMETKCSNRTITANVLSVRHQELEEGVLSNNPLQYINDNS